MLAAIEDPEVIPRMLESMGLPSTEPLTPRRARCRSSALNSISKESAI
jgi:hypothetical protein